MTGAVMIVGASSGAGKSTVSAALCRAWARQHRDVVPFKAQNLSNHAAVTADGGEVGRAQALQARAAGVEVDRRMNPVLLKPAPEARAHLVVLGQEVMGSDARGQGLTAAELRPVVLQALTELRTEHDWVVLEGAGAAAEINLLDRDMVNLPLAAAAGVPAVLVVDIDRGGGFASAYGTIALLPERLRHCLVGLVFNRFRGDPALLDRGIAELALWTGVPVLGVLPHLGEEPMLGVEDSLDLGAAFESSRQCGPAPVRVAVVRLPHLANPSDIDPLVLEPDVVLRWATHPRDLVEADLVILPGSRATAEDLAWLRRQGLAEALRTTSASVLGLCGGYQMLGTWIEDEVESGLGVLEGLGLLDVRTVFAEPKVVQRSAGRGEGRTIAGYEIRWGRPCVGADPWLEVDGEAEGAQSTDRRVRGTSLHGLLDNDDFRAALLSEIAEARGRQYTPTPTAYQDAVEAHLDRLADWLTAHVDLARLTTLASDAVTVGWEPGW
ncbi:MAG TPA: cobyric acid synthase [Ornithinimicrobium sp.]|uniref:cobyric acid synthase n=1 Tax=Ornithinimicrobium sp. TaxID=1977084 RepID=UPI002B461C46|nr:cobyric acid synthase [Ornithinimicrobium sp.]HKJ12205.1 cobyric acid synthase [Ornithinimicrobium sp.]